MTLTKTATNYTVQDTIDEVKVYGNVSVNVNGSIDINISTDDGGYLNYNKNNDGHVNFSSSFLEENDLIDYAQTLIAAIMQQLESNQE